MFTLCTRIVSSYYILVSDEKIIIKNNSNIIELYEFRIYKIMCDILG